MECAREGGTKGREREQSYQSWEREREEGRETERLTKQTKTHNEIGKTKANEHKKQNETGEKKKQVAGISYVYVSQRS